MNIPDTLSHFRLAPQAPDRQHVFGWGTTTPLFHNGFKLFMNSHLNFYSFTARRIRDRSIVFDLQNCNGRIILGSQRFSKHVNPQKIGRFVLCTV